jgi:hypothetical protein
VHVPWHHHDVIASLFEIFNSNIAVGAVGVVPVPDSRRLRNDGCAMPSIVFSFISYLIPIVGATAEPLIDIIHYLYLLLGTRLIHFTLLPLAFLAVELPRLPWPTC